MFNFVYFQFLPHHFTCITKNKAYENRSIGYTGCIVRSALKTAHRHCNVLSGYREIYFQTMFTIIFLYF